MQLQEIPPGDDRSLQDIADLLVKSHRVVVITGAGISTSCGIPDFRSKDGLYNLIPDQPLPTPPSSAPSTPSRKRKASFVEDDSTPPSSQASSTSQRSLATSRLRGQDLFDASVWKNAATTATFYQFIASLRQKIQKDVQNATWSHRFLRALRDGGRLMRCYTQNIDGLEAREGLETTMSCGPGTKRRFMRKTFEEPRPSQTHNTDFDGGCEVVQLHGDLEKTRCSLCQALHDWDEAATLTFLDGEAPPCQQCRKKNDEREAKGKRGVSVGLLRPNIVLYGEEHPANHVLAPFVPFDLASNPEVLIIMGTSLKVFGLQKIVKDFAKRIHSRKDGKGRVIFVNRTKPAESVWDGVIDQYVAMDCDDWVRDLRVRREDLWLRQGELDLKTTKPIMKRKRKDSGTSDRPTKKLKKTSPCVVSVEISTVPSLSDRRPKCSGSKKAAELPQPQPSRTIESKAGPYSQVAPFTPPRPQCWKQATFVHSLVPKSSPMAPPYSPLSPVGRSCKTRPFELPTGVQSPLEPEYSPLCKSFKPPAPASLVPSTPEQVSYLPLTPLRRNREVEVYADPDTAIPEDDVDAKDVTSKETVADESLIRKILRRPLSLSRSNAWTGSAKTAASAGHKGNGRVSGSIHDPPPER